MGDMKCTLYTTLTGTLKGKKNLKIRG